MRSGLNNSQSYMLGSSWYIKLLGGLAAERDGHPLVRFQTRKTGGLLGYLAYHMPAGQARERLVDQFWPSLDSVGGRNCLATSLTSLRRQLEPPDLPAGSVVIATRLDVRLNPASVTTDVQELQALAEPLADGESDEECIRSGAKAISLYRGFLLPGCYEDWVEPERERLAAVFLRLAARTVQALERNGDQERALEYALAAAGAAPDQEATHREVIRLYRGLGRDVDAVRQYRLLEERMREQWGNSPSHATRSLLEGLGLDKLAQRRVLRQMRQRELISPKPPPVVRQPSVPLVPQALTKTVTQKILLPTPINQFFGREGEIEFLRDSLQAPNVDEVSGTNTGRSRLITITGPAGSGKTRLALEAARRMAARFEGAAFAALGSLSDESLIYESVLTAIGSKQGVESSHLDQVVSALTGSDFLLVLDNAEHLGTAISEAAETLTSRLPGLSILVTSRVPLGVSGERLLPLSPMPTPGQETCPERLLQFACVRMFVDRAQAVSPDFQITPRNSVAIASVCQKLEGIPLAIELAAARVTALTPSQMLSELEERFSFLVSNRRTVEERHRTLSAALRWSYELLPAATQRFFNRLSVFRGGWTLEGARAIWPAGSGEGTALDHLERLVEQALISADDLADGKRFRMLESVREFVHLEFTSDDRRVSSELLTRHVIDLAESESPRLRSPNSAESVSKLQPELANFRTVLSARGGHPDGLRLAAGLWRLWALTGQAKEGAEWLKSALASCPDAPASIRSSAWIGLGVLLRYQRDYEGALDAAKNGLALAQTVEAPALQADALNLLAVLNDERDNTVEARSLLDQSLAIRRALGDTWSVAGALNNLGRIAQRDGDLLLARRCYEESQDLYKVMNDWAMAAVVLSNLGVTADELGDFATARASYEQSLSIFRELGLKSDIGPLLYNLGEALFRGSDHPDAPSYFCDSLKELLEQGDRACAALPLAGLASVASRRGDLTRSVRLHAAAHSVREKFGTVVNSNGRQLYERELGDLRTSLPAHEFESAWLFGRSLTLEQAAAYASEATSSSALPAIKPENQRPVELESTLGEPRFTIMV